MTTTDVDRLLTQGEVERQLMTTQEALEDETYRYADVSEEAANAEADYKGDYARAMIHMASTSTGEKVTVGERDARATDRTIDQFRMYRIMEARKAASKEALLSLRSRIDALRTLSANIRQST